MSRVFAAISLLALVSLCASGAVLDFEDLSGSAVLPSNYGGLTWSDGWNYYDAFQDPYNPASGLERVYNNDGSAPPRVWFPTATAFNGAYFAGSGSAQFELFLEGNLVGSSSTIGLSSTPTFLTSGYAGLVDEVHMIVSQGSFVMDDFTYDATQATVPEPSSALMLGAGLLAVWWKRKR